MGEVVQLLDRRSDTVRGGDAELREEVDDPERAQVLPENDSEDEEDQLLLARPEADQHGEDQRQRSGAAGRPLEARVGIGTRTSIRALIFRRLEFKVLALPGRHVLVGHQILALGAFIDAQPLPGVSARPHAADVLVRVQGPLQLFSRLRNVRVCKHRMLR